MPKTIDLTDIYNTSYWRGKFQGIDRDASNLPSFGHTFRHIATHHTGSHRNAAGKSWAYGVRTDAEAKNMTQYQEETAILSLARDHLAKFGGGPGYNYAVFSSGRRYAIGKAGTVRRHTSTTAGRTDGNTWNWDSWGVVLWGNLQYMTPSDLMEESYFELISEIAGYTQLNTGPLSVFGHRDKYNTVCPGDGGEVLARKAHSLLNPTSEPEPEPEPEPFNRYEVITHLDYIDKWTLATQAEVLSLRTKLGL